MTHHPATDPLATAPVGYGRLDPLSRQSHAMGLRLLAEFARTGATHGGPIDPLLLPVAHMDLCRAPALAALLPAAVLALLATRTGVDLQYVLTGAPSHNPPPAVPLDEPAPPAPPAGLADMVEAAIAKRRAPPAAE